MATASHIQLIPATAGVYHVPSLTQESCKAASNLLQENHDKYHMLFNQQGFHNHIAHHLLTIFALGASPDELQRAFDRNRDCQRPQFPVNEENVHAMHDDEKWKGFLGKEKYFHDFEAFFKKEIDEKGWEDVLQERLFAKTDRAEDLLVRMYAGKSCTSL
jgi:Questin oxidase-like